MEANAFYERLDEETFEASRATASPWDERLQHGSPPTALVAHVMTQRHPRDEMRIARVNSEFLGPLPLARMRVKTRVVRPGKRIEMLEGIVESGGREVLTARAWRIATQSDGSVPPAATPPDPVPAIPEPRDPPAWMKKFGYGEAFEWRHVYGGGVPGPAAVWSRPRIPLIAGEPLAPLDRALLVADSANGISGELPMGEWLFVPPSLSVALQRYTRGEWTLLEARTTLTSDGLGLTTLRLADPDGYFAAGTQALLVERRA
ncbi:MAG: thioesterase family protein [Candidatus Eremiobacteraeota bacterium]|nr:thioesterase family protein [Candidatus Eremiobacteraeota bacterium]